MARSAMDDEDSDEMSFESSDAYAELEEIEERHRSGGIATPSHGECRSESSDSNSSDSADTEPDMPSLIPVRPDLTNYDIESKPYWEIIVANTAKRKAEMQKKYAEMKANNALALFLCGTEAVTLFSDALGHDYRVWITDMCAVSRRGEKKTHRVKIKGLGKADAEKRFCCRDRCWWTFAETLQWIYNEREGSFNDACAFWRRYCNELDDFLHARGYC